MSMVPPVAVRLIWIRAEHASVPPRGGVYPDQPALPDSRAPLTPDDALLLLQSNSNLHVVIEHSSSRCFPDSLYTCKGCELVPEDAWTQDPRALLPSTLILGIRRPSLRLHPFQLSLPGTHLCFAHLFNHQPDRVPFLTALARAQGTLLDYEQLIDPVSHLRLASFGHVAGAIALATALFAWCRQQLAQHSGLDLPVALLDDAPLEHRLEAWLNLAVKLAGRASLPSVGVLGAKGRCGSGAMALAKQLGLPCRGWSRQDTEHESVADEPMLELLEYDVVLNATRTARRSAFLTHDTIRQEPRSLSVLVDLTCEPGTEGNVLPLYEKCTTFEQPTLSLIKRQGPHLPLDLIAIPNFPTLLPLESSRAFSSQLVRLLLEYPQHPAWQTCREVFYQHVHGNDQIIIPEPLQLLHPQMMTRTIRLPRDATLQRSLEAAWTAVRPSSLNDGGLDAYQRSEHDGVVSLEAENRVVIRCDSHHLHLAMCPSLADEASIWLCLRQLSRALLDPVLPAPLLSLCDAVRPSWSSSLLELEREESFLYWKNVLENPLFGSAPLLHVTPDRLREQMLLPGEAVWTSLTIDASLHDRDLVEPAVLAALVLTLHRWTDQDDLCLSSQMSFRSFPDLKHVCAPLSHPGFLRLHLDDPSQSFHHICLQSQSQLASLFSHDSIPIPSSIFPSSPPEICFNLINLEFLDPDLDPIPFVPHPDPLPAPLQLAFTFYRLPHNRFLLSVQSSAAFHPPTLHQLLSQIQHVLQAPLSSPLDQISLLNQPARASLPDPRAPLDCSWPGSISQILLERAHQHPDRVAVVDEQHHEPLSYFQLEQMSLFIAANLPRNTEVVAIVGRRCRALVACIMGVLRRGAAYCMLDPAYPLARLQVLVEVAQPDVMVMFNEKDAMMMGKVQGEKLKMRIVVNDDIGLIPGLEDEHAHEEGESNASEGVKSGSSWTVLKVDPSSEISIDSSSIDVDLTPDHIAVLTFTSGSSGIPKAVQGRHGPLTHFYPWMSSFFSLSHSDRFALSSGIAHDPLQRDIFTPLFLGASLWIPLHRDILHPGALSRWMHLRRLTVCCLTPALGQVLCAQPPAAPLPLRRVFFVGDKLLQQDVLRLLQHLSPEALCINMYGSTETQRSVSFWIASPEAVQNHREVLPVGRGMGAGCQLILLHPRSGRRVAPGERGEIYVRGPHLSLGYLGRDEETKTRFLPNRWRENDPRDRMYRTGDVGRYVWSNEEQGWIVECLGRVDQQVKLRGFRIELGEIQACLLQHEMVREALLTLWEERQQLIAYVVLKQNHREVNESQVKQTLLEHVARVLPGYMVPSHLLLLEALPLTPNGKIHMARLPLPSSSTKDASNDGSEHEWTALQRTIAVIWAQHLQMESLPSWSLDLNFFDLGGHSVSATLASLALAQVHPPAVSLFQYPTLRAVSERLHHLQHQQKQPKNDPHLDLSSLALQFTFAPGTSSSSIHHDPNASPRVVLLTGSTGFLGAFLLESLLQDRELDRVICIVRAPNDFSARERLLRAARDHCLQLDLDRVQVLAGDLAQPLLGLAPQVWRRLLDQVDTILHNGAWVHWLHPYAVLAPVNVHGTFSLLQMASQASPPMRFHYVSTTSVLQGAAAAAAAAGDDALPSLGQDLVGNRLVAPADDAGGYAHSKWVAEQVVARAQQAVKLPAKVYRPGYVTGHSRLGLWTTDDFLCRLIKGCIEMGACPFMEFGTAGQPVPVLDCSPVDYVSAFIAKSVLNPRFEERSDPVLPAVHVVNPRPVPYHRLFQVVRSFGFEIAALPYPVWRERLLQEAAAPEPRNALLPVLSQFTSTWMDELVHRVPVEASSMFQRAVPFPKDMDAALRVNVAYLVQCGFLPAPVTQPDDHLQLDWGLIAHTDAVRMLSRTDRH